MPLGGRNPARSCHALIEKYPERKEELSQFKASAHYIKRMLNPQCYKSQLGAGKAGSVDTAQAKQAMEQFATDLATLDIPIKNVYNKDETGMR